MGRVWLLLCALTVAPVMVAVVSFEMRRKRDVVSATAAPAVLGGGAALFAGILISMALGAMPGALIGLAGVAAASGCCAGIPSPAEAPRRTRRRSRTSPAPIRPTRASSSSGKAPVPARSSRGPASDGTAMAPLPAARKIQPVVRPLMGISWLASPNRVGKIAELARPNSSATAGRGSQPNCSARAAASASPRQRRSTRNGVIRRSRGMASRRPAESVTQNSVTSRAALPAGMPPRVA